MTRVMNNGDQCVSYNYELFFIIFLEFSKEIIAHYFQYIFFYVNNKEKLLVIECLNF